MIDEPLVKALVDGEAVAFIGAGVSVASGLPLWSELLTGLLARAESSSSKQLSIPSDEWKLTRKFLAQNDYLLAAEMLHQGLPESTFRTYIKGTLDNVPEPNDLHYSIARLPFSLALTVNFDTLLERANPKAPCYTWKDHDAIFHAIREKEFAIVKLHGSVNDVDAVRLTRTQYRQAEFETPEFNECLKSLLTWKTFLFIGYSLRDSDLLHLLDTTRSRFGKRFGPHYAIMPKDEVDEKFEKYLNDALSIKVLPYTPEEIGRDGMTKAVVDMLTKLAGRVAKLRYKTQGFGLSDPLVTRAEAVQKILDYAVPLMGSSRGEICLIESETRPMLQRLATYPQTSKLVPPKIVPNSVITSAFLQTNPDSERDYIYIPNVSKAKETLRGLGYPYADYVVCDTSVKSELACPIIAEGRRVGTLNFEANLTNAYIGDHFDVARKIASEVGSIQLQSEQRRRSAAPLVEYYRKPTAFADLLYKSKLIESMEHDFLLYEIDHEGKCLSALHSSDTGYIRYTFEQQSLATKVFETHQPRYVLDAHHEIALPPKDRPNWLNEVGVKKYDMKGPVFACPVRVAGHTEAVLVTWIKASDGRDEKLLEPSLHEEFCASCGQVQRLTSLLANDLYGPNASRASQLLDSLYKNLRKVDKGQVWRRPMLGDPDFRRDILGALMESATSESGELFRVRIWRTLKFDASGDPLRFRCIDSLTTSRIQKREGTPERGAYESIEVPTDDPYTRHTISRYRHDPYAKWQYPVMFDNQPDINAGPLDKDPEGSWIVAPVVRTSMLQKKPRLLGFISADRHIWTDDGPKEQPVQDQRLAALQCRFLDVIADLAQYVMLGQQIEAARTRKTGA